MALDNQQGDTVLRWLANKACPMCGQAVWTVSPEIVAAAVVRNLGSGDVEVLRGGSLLPMVQATCNECGFVSHFAAAKIGVISK